MTYDEKEIQKLIKIYEVINEIISPQQTSHVMKADLSKVEEILKKTIPDALKENAPDDFYVLYTDFKAEYDKFRDFILYEPLIGKNIIALGGGFSTGKSSFLNTLMGHRVLPEDIDPSTSVPTYIVKGDTHEVTGINIFDSVVKLETSNIRSIAHGFGEVFDGEDKALTKSSTLGHILETLFFSTKFHNYDRIAFLDTPGYSKAENKKSSVRTDEQIARGQLNSANYILWFVKAESGTITEEDIKFIKTLRNDIPKLIVLNKSEMRPLEDIKAIKAKSKETLDIKGVKYVDVLAFSSRVDDATEDKLKAYIEADTALLKQQIDAWNKEAYVSNFARNFKVLFVRCREFYEDAIDEESRKLSRLNTSLTKLSVQDIEPDVIEPLQLLVKDTKREVAKLKALKEKLKEIQDDFFAEIKRVGDIVGIAMPEPSEIDLMKDKESNAKEVLEAYKKEKGIKTNPEIIHLLKDVLSDITPVIAKKPGGSQFTNELAAQLKNELNIDPSKIRIHDPYKNDKAFKELMKTIL